MNSWTDPLRTRIAQLQRDKSRAALYDTSGLKGSRDSRAGCARRNRNIYPRPRLAGWVIGVGRPQQKTQNYRRHSSRKKKNASAICNSWLHPSYFRFEGVPWDFSAISALSRMPAAAAESMSDLDVRASLPDSRNAFAAETVESRSSTK